MKVTIIEHVGYGSVCGHAYRAIADNEECIDVEGAQIRLYAGVERIIYDEDFIPNAMLPLAVEMKDEEWAREADDYYVACDVCATEFNVHITIGASTYCPFCGSEVLVA